MKGPGKDLMIWLTVHRGTSCLGKKDVLSFRKLLGHSNLCSYFKEE